MKPRCYATILVFAITALFSIGGCGKEASTKSGGSGAAAASKASGGIEASSELPGNGTFGASSGVAGAQYRISFEFDGDKYTKYLYFEDELVWKCEGKFVFEDSVFVRTNRVCQFFRAEDPRPPSKYEDLSVPLRNTTKDAFDLLLTDQNSEALGESGWVTLSRVKTAQ